MAFFDSTKMISDPDSLIYYAGASGSAPVSANMTIDYTAKTIQLKLGATGAGALLVEDGGATGKCVYSKLKEVWKSDSTLIKFPFPMLPITDEQFELINGWDFADLTTKQLIRTAGWALKSSDGLSTYEEYTGVISLGTLASTSHQIYYTQIPMTTIAATGSTTNFALTGPVNQAIKIYGDVSHGNFNYRSYLKLFVREYGSLYANSTLPDIGVSTLTYQTYRFPVTTSTDLKATTTPPTGAPYTGMSIKWETTPQSHTATTAANYNVTIEANNGTAKQVYEFVQYALRHGNVSDVDTNATAGYVKFGEVAPDLLHFVGDTLYVNYQTVGATGGVWVNNISAVDTNSIYFYDNTNTIAAYPYQAVLRLNFGDNLINDTVSKYYVFFTDDNAGDNTGRDYGTANAILVKNASSVDMTGAVSGISGYPSTTYVDLTYDYDGNEQRGTTSKGVDAPVTVIALGFSGAQYVKSTGIIAKSKANSISLVSSLERNASNPV